MRARRTALVPALAATTLLLVVGCGNDASSEPAAGSGGTTAASPATTAPAAAAPGGGEGLVGRLAPAGDLTSFEATITTQTAAGDSVMDVTHTTVDGKGRTAFSMALGGQRTHGVVTSTDLYLGGALAEVVPGKRYVRMPLDRDDTYAELIASFGQVAGFRQQLEQWSQLGDFTEAGAEKVGGVQTTKYVGKVDLDRLGDDVPAELKDAAEALKGGTATFAVWIDGQGRPVKMTSSSTGAVGSDVTVEYRKWGEKLTVQVPKASETMDLPGL